MRRLRSDARRAAATVPTLATIALASITVLAVMPATSWGEVVGDAKRLEDARVLEVAAKVYRENLDRLKTWQGSVDYVHKVTDRREPGTISIIETRNSFACSRTDGMLRFNIDVIKDDLLAGNRCEPRFPGMGKEHLAGLSRDGEHYYIVYRDGSERRATVSSKPRRHPASWSIDSYVVFDPVYYFTNRGGALDEYLKFLLKEFNEPMLDSRVSQDKSFVTIKTNGSRHEYTTVFDLDQGANLVLQTITDRSNEAVSTSTYKWQWHQVSGVFVPRSFEYNHVDGESPPKNVERRLTWTKSVVNEPIEETELDLPKIGLRAEDLLYDDRDRTLERSIDLLRFPRPERRQPARR